ARGHRGPRRRNLSTHRRTAVRSGPLDGVCRGSVVAVEDDGGVDRSHVRVFLAAGNSMAGASVSGSVGIIVSDASGSGDLIGGEVKARRAAFTPVAGGGVSGTVTLAGGDGGPV